MRAFKRNCLFSQNYLARNFYNLRFLALFVAFAINFILLFYKVNSATWRHKAQRFLFQLTQQKTFCPFSGDGRLLRRRGPVERSPEDRGGGRGGCARVLYPAGKHRLHGTSTPLPGHTAHNHFLLVCGGILLPKGTRETVPSGSHVLVWRFLTL